jgi:ABC-type spermidine/putrescine transport system permease subunit I
VSISTSHPGAVPTRPWNPSRGYLLLLAVPVAALLILFVWPLAMLAIRSVTDPSLGLANYREVFSRSAYIRVLLYTLQVGTTVTLLCLVMSYPVAVAMSLARGRWLGLMLALVLIPFWTSAVIRTYSWMVLFQSKGVLNSFLVSVGIIDKPLALMNNSIGVHIGMVHVLMPFMILPLLSSLRSIDPNYMRAAGLLGANPVKAFVHVYLPLSMPGISAGCALVFITALGFYITPALLGGMSNMMIAVLIDQQVNMAVNWGVASALATLLLIVTSVLYFGYERILRRAGGGGVLD